LDGLEAVEMKFSEVLNGNDSFRFDSEFFKKEYLCNIKKLISSKSGFSLLQEHIEHLSGGATPLGAEYQEDGISFLRVQNIMRNFFNLTDMVYISDVQNTEIKRSQLKKRDVLLTITGVSYGKSAVVTDTLVGANINQHSVKITLNGLNPYFLSTFLNSINGKLQTDKYVVGVTRPALDYDSIKKIIIPNFSTVFQLKIERLISVFEDIDSGCEKLYTKAETLLLETLGIADFSPSVESVNIKSFKDSFGTTGRLDAEYYQPKYEQLEKIIAQNHVLDSLGNLLTLNRRGSQPNYAEQGLPVINSKHVREGEVVLSDNRYAVLAEKENTLIIQKNDVLVNGTGVGTIGRAAPYLHDEPALPDNHVTILRTDKINPIFLSVYLNSIAGKYQVDKYFKGSSGQIELYPDDINCFYVPLVDDAIQTQIADLVQQSFALKKESEQLLEKAKQAVELAIEQGEEVAMGYLGEVA
jgi:type I restriction enzyme M protein